ncbi:MAG: chromate efflux transporter [Aquincola tertiaricarbonis]
MSNTTAPPSSAAAGFGPAPVSLAQAFAFWLKLGFVSFGGPAGQIALMHAELVERRRWISERRFLHALNYCMVLPGPEAQQLATYIGWLMHRTAGGLVAGGLFVLPSLLLLIGLSWLYLAHGQVPAVAGVLYGIKPAVTAIVLAAAWRIGSRVLRNAWMWALAAGAFVALFAFDLPFPLIIAAAAGIGFLGGRWSPDSFMPRAAGHAPAGASAPVAQAPALIDDDTPTPAHARFTWRRFGLVLAAFIGLWLLAFGALAARFGLDGALTQMAWFFTKAALMTFGGAYAVLPYVYQGAVDDYRWLTGTQMIDGLALGETTPGPLIMVVAFVGFVGGWGRALFGPDALALAGIAGACVVTLFTFLPSFCFILLGGPFIETTHGKLGFTAPLTAITAAVVGVIVNLAVFFAQHVLWPQGVAGGMWQGFDPVAAVLGGLAAIALFSGRVGVIPVILASGAAGALLTLLR